VKFALTFYHPITLEDPKTWGYPDPGAQDIMVERMGVRHLPTAFVKALRMEGIAMIDGQPVIFDGVRFMSLNRDLYPWGKDATGRPLEPYRSVAVDSRIIPLHTSLINLLALQGKHNAAGAQLDTWAYPDDRGGRIRGLHLDYFVRTPADARAIGAQLPVVKEFDPTPRALPHKGPVEQLRILKDVNVLDITVDEIDKKTKTVRRILA
jgi:3D (Asp-Asp-Asp) domain-containing protein